MDWGFPGNAGSVSSIPGLEAKIPQLAKNKKHKNQKQYCNKFNKDFENGLHLKKILMDQQVEEERGGHPPPTLPLLPGLSFQAEDQSNKSHNLDRKPPSASPIG